MVLVLEPSGSWEKKYRGIRLGEMEMCMLEMPFTGFNSQRSTIICLVPKNTNANKGFFNSATLGAESVGYFYLSG
jgi:hypothetical protein